MKINKNKVAVIADLHIGKHGASNMWFETTLNWVKWFALQCKEHKIQDIIILGDLFESRYFIPVLVLDFVSEVFKHLEDFNIIITIGNHDCFYNYRYDANSLKIFQKWEGINVLSDIKTIKVFGKTLSFCPWACDVNVLPDSDIIFGHFDIKAFQTNQYHKSTVGVSAADLLKRSDIVMSGHYHLSQEKVFKDPNKTDKLKKVIYVGSPFQLSWHEQGQEKGFYILDITNMSTEFITNPISPKHKKMVFDNNIKTSDQLKNMISDAKGHICEVVVDYDYSKSENIEASKMSLERCLNLIAESALKIKFVYAEYENDFNEGVEFVSQGVDVLGDIVAYTKENENVTFPEETIEYLKKQYQVAESKSSGSEDD